MSWNIYYDETLSILKTHKWLIENKCDFQFSDIIKENCEEELEQLCDEKITENQLEIYKKFEFTMEWYNMVDFPQKGVLFVVEDDNKQILYKIQKDFL